MDRKNIQLIILIVLIACTQAEIPIAQEVKNPQEIEKKVEFEEETPARVVQTTDTNYLLSEDNRLLAIEKITGNNKEVQSFSNSTFVTKSGIEKPTETWKFYYKNKELTNVRGPKNVELNYAKQLRNLEKNGLTLTFRYDSRNRLVEVKGGRENLYLEYDSLDLLREVRRGIAGKTSIDYDKQGKIKYLTRGLVTTNVYYTNHSFVKNFDADDTKMILGYWKDDKISSLTGNKFGQGLTISYGPDYPPKEAKIIHYNDDAVFKASSTEALYAVVDKYIYCNYISSHEDLLFDGTSYIFFTNYFKEDATEYFIMQILCDVYRQANLT